MLIPPRYTLNTKITKLLSSIEASREIVELFKLDPKIELNIRRQSTLSSSLYSARIEGNPLSLSDVDLLNTKDRKKLEVFNLLKATSYAREGRGGKITSKEILTMHTITLGGRAKSKIIGFRTNMEAVFNSAGIAVYMPPPPRLVKAYVNKLLAYANSEKEKLVPVKAALVHYVFEKIHPFLDANGRVGRLVMQRVLASGGYAMKGLLPLEEYLDAHRAVYYRMLEEPEKDLTGYLEFILTAISETAKKTKRLVLEKQEPNAEDFLLPRRAEIYKIIKDHKMVSFDQIRRRFMKVNERTLRFDLKKLQDKGFVRKLGETKGVYYAANSAE
jgi:Fic family protein